MLMDYFAQTWVKIVTTSESVRKGLTILNFKPILEVHSSNFA